MNLLLDTHVAIWALNDDPLLSDRARELILDVVAVGPLTKARFWEITAIPDIRVQCARLAETVAARVAAPGPDR